MYPTSIENLIESFKLLPGIGEKTAERLVFSLLDMEQENIDFFVLCVIDDAKTIFLFEKMNVFNGYYHVLDGLISPIDGINPEDIGIEKLLDRIKKEEYQEIIFAFKPSIEGETTSSYIKKIISDIDIKVTRLASGLPMGADIEYVDSLTLERALNDRTEIS